MQLVEGEKPQALRRPHDLLFSHSREHQLQHDVVGQDHVGRVVPDVPPLLVRFLPCVPPHLDWRAAGKWGCVEKLAEFPQLAVGQSVHWVDDDGLNALAGAVAQDVVDDRNDVAEAFARARPGGEDVVGSRAGDPDRLVLMPVERHRQAGVVGRLLFAKDL